MQVILNAQMELIIYLIKRRTHNEGGERRLPDSQNVPLKPKKYFDMIQKGGYEVVKVWE
jgi:hypothetical protein